MAIKEVRVKSVIEFIQAVKNAKAEYEKEGFKDDLIFRGQKEDWPLLPKLARLNKSKSLNGRIRKVEQLMIEEFQRNLLPLSDFRPDNVWDLLALAQHYGLPTRLLDWSFSALVALWFTVNGVGTPGKNGVVWILKTKAEDFIKFSGDRRLTDIKTSKIFRSSIVSRRISSQVGLFTAHHITNDAKVFRFETTENYKTRLVKILISPDDFPSIRKDIHILGFNHSTVYPDMIGLSNHLEWRFSKYSDEALLKI